MTDPPWDEEKEDVSVRPLWAHPPSAETHLETGRSEYGDDGTLRGRGDHGVSLAGKGVFWFRVDGWRKGSLAFPRRSQESTRNSADPY